MPAVRIRVTGTVQGVGFRPFCYREAARRGLAGFVLNDLGGVEIVLEGAQKAIEDFLKTLRENPPPASRITGIRVSDIPERGFKGFKIIESQAAEASQALEVSADLATCSSCREEILNPQDRRQGYAFTNCTDCGPRYTIIRELPYDRPKTTMQGFRMCASCQREYEDPLDRRFHAQPNACKVCGPELLLLDSKGRVVRCVDPIAEAVRLILEGKIVALKGLGGYHLVCDATNVEAIKELRRRKRRPHKALALMAKDVSQARTLAVIGEEEEALLRSAAAPILLLPWAPDVPRELREAIAPLNPGVGIMLAYTPLHHLLFAAGVNGRHVEPVIATSANHGDEPLVADERELFEYLGGVFDAVLAHNRDIENRIDDSVGFRAGTPKSTDPWWSGLYLVRRARGFAPQPLEAPFEFPPALAVGAEMKGSFALSDGSRVWLSPHIGELTNRGTVEFFEETLETYMRWFRVEPQIVAADMHPDYLSTRWAERYSEEEGVPLIRVQHHHAHIASVIFEHHIEEPVIGLSLDGTGYGPDGSLWGCELLYVTDFGARFERLGHLRGLALVGGELAIRRPRRMAAGVVADLFGASKAAELFGEEGRIAAKMLESDAGELRVLRVLRASSAGRLFDAAAGLLGLVDEISFEAQAAIALESLATPELLEKAEGYPFEITKELIIDPEPCFAAILDDLKKGKEPSEISGRFHKGLADALLAWALKACETRGTRILAASGGVFLNRTLLRAVEEGAKKHGLKLFLPRLIPASDGGLAAGQIQVVAALARLGPI